MTSGRHQANGKTAGRVIYISNHFPFILKYFDFVIQPICVFSSVLVLFMAFYVVCGLSVDVLLIEVKPIRCKQSPKVALLRLRS